MRKYLLLIFSNNNHSNSICKFGIILLFICVHGSFALSQYRVYVQIETDQYIIPQSHSCIRIRLTYRVPSTKGRKPHTIYIDPGWVGSGAGMVVEHLSTNGSITKKERQFDEWNCSHIESLNVNPFSLTLSFSFYVSLGNEFNISKLGIYRIYYLHPWQKKEDESAHVIFVSDTLTIACITQEQYNELLQKLRKKPELAFACLWFKHPPTVLEFPQFNRVKYLDIIDKEIKEGMSKAEILLYLGSPDYIRFNVFSLQDKNDFERWTYTTSPVASYNITFSKGLVIKKYRHANYGGADN